VNINVDTNTTRVDGVKFQSGCTGTINSLNITTQSGDAIKIQEGAHDLTVNGGSVICTDKLPTLHQDALQALGGSNVKFNNVTLSCGRTNQDLIDANWRVAKAGASVNPPDGIVCDHCYLGPDTAHTVDIQESTNSGVSNSTVCPSKFHKAQLTFTIGPDAVNPINDSNTFPDSC